MALIKCSECGRDISSAAEACPHCGKPLASTIKCPTCKSPDVEKISGLSKAGSVALWGVFAIGKVSKTYRCKKCGAQW
jgi:predicted RNA-binding Zn-ribbon protein involved in translation (DUF1610 family)